MNTKKSNWHPTKQELKNWRNMQRSRYHLGLLTPDEIKKLEALPGWTWKREEKEEVAK